MKNPFLVDVLAIRRHHGEQMPVSIRAPLQGITLTETWVDQDESVTVDVVLEAVEGGVNVQGTVTAPWLGECRRCLTEVGGIVTVPVAEIYVDNAPSEDSFEVHKDRVDLEPLAREAVALALPLAPLCRDDCLGLCATCGADRNEGPCGCPPDADLG